MPDLSEPFALCTIRQNVSLAPVHQSNPQAGIDEELSGMLMRYSDRLEGVVLAFQKVALEGKLGSLVNDSPYVHTSVRADALVFRPQVGMLLKGLVNKIGSNHIGLLFAGVFNGSVSANELPTGYVHNYHEDSWLAEDGSAIRVDDQVIVQVQKVHVAGGVIALEATMRSKTVDEYHDPSSVQENSPVPSPTKKHVKEKRRREEEQIPSPKKHKKSKKKKQRPS